MSSGSGRGSSKLGVVILVGHPKIERMYSCICLIICCFVGLEVNPLELYVTLTLWVIIFIYRMR